MTVSEVADSGETSNGGAQSAESEVSSPVLPCALSILQFYVGIIQKHSLPDSAAASRAAASVASHLKQVRIFRSMTAML